MKTGFEGKGLFEVVTALFTELVGFWSVVIDVALLAKPHSLTCIHDRGLQTLVWGLHGFAIGTLQGGSFKRRSELPNLYDDLKPFKGDCKVRYIWCNKLV